MKTKDIQQTSGLSRASKKMPRNRKRKCGKIAQALLGFGIDTCVAWVWDINVFADVAPYYFNGKYFMGPNRKTGLTWEPTASRNPQIYLHGNLA